MDSTNDRLLLKKILNRYDQLGAIRKQLFEERSNPASVERLRRQSRRKIDEIEREFKEHRFHGPLSTLLARYNLDKYQLVLILALLRQRLVASTPFLTGRELLQNLYDDSYGILQGMSLIDASSVLVSTGILIPEISDDPSDDVLDTRYRLSDRVFDMIYSTFAGGAGRDYPRLPRTEGGYRKNLAYLMDLRKLTFLYQKRATKVFNYDYWEDIGLGVAESVQAIDRQIEQWRRHIRRRLDRTENRDRLYTWKFAQEYDLGEEEMVVLVTLAFQELTEGNAYLNAVDLLRLTARSEEDLVRKRRFFSSREPLVKHRLVQLEEMVNGKELTAEVCLPNWVLEKMLSGSESREGRIDVDARLDFHDYLKNLDSSEEFLDDLDN